MWAWKADISACAASRTAWRCWGARSRSRAHRAGAPPSPSRCPRNESPSMIRVLLADDHAIVLEGLRALLDGEPDITVAGWTTDGTEVVKLVQQHRPDVVVLDLELTTIKGTEVLAALRERPAPPKVLALTAYNDGESLRSAHDAGADGLAIKTESPQQSLTAIRQVHAGQLVCPLAARRWIEARAAGAPGDLTPREREVWTLVAGGKTQGLQKAIATNLSGVVWVWIAMAMVGTMNLGSFSWIVFGVVAFMLVIQSKLAALSFIPGALRRGGDGVGDADRSQRLPH